MALLELLADGRFHSGQRLAEQMGVSRTAVWKRLQGLQQRYGLRVDAVRGRGYRLAGPLDLLDSQQIRDHLSPLAAQSLSDVSVTMATASTNESALQTPPEGVGAGRVWMAEYQHAGRGRRGRTWHSVFGGNLSLSLAWRFDLPIADLAGLSLAAGVVLAETLRDQGLSGHTLKWPNDILVADRKLAGILVEASGEATGPAVGVIGLGLNLRMPDASGAGIDQPWTDLARAGVELRSRNRFAATLVSALAEACTLYQSKQLQPFLSRWEGFDHCRNRRVRLIGGSGTTVGICRGIASSGALLLETDEGCREFRAGEISLRPVGDNA